MTVTAYVEAWAAAVLLKENGSIVTRKLLLSTTPSIIYLKRYSSSSRSTCHMCTYHSAHTHHTHHASLGEVNTRIKVMHPNLLCDCCCTVAAT